MAQWVVEAEGLGGEVVQETIDRLRTNGFAIFNHRRTGSGVCSIRSTIVGSVEILVSLPDRPGALKPIRPFRHDRVDFHLSEQGPASALASEAGRLMSWAQKYKNLVDSVRSETAIAFIGAGLSRPLGYPSWGQLIKRLAEEASLSVTEQELEGGGETYLDIAQQCQERLGSQRYFDFLRRLFQLEAGAGFREYHSMLWRMPFASYITTNFDACIEIAAERDGASVSVQAWPRFSSRGLSERHIIHLHGKIPRDGEPPKSIDTIRLTRNDYREAYEQRQEIGNLIGNALANGHHFVFLGYSLRDPDVRRVLGQAWKRKVDSIAFAASFGLGADSGSAHFALLPAETIEPKSGSTFEKDYGINVVELAAGDDGHKQIFQIICDLHERTVQITPARLLGAEWSLTEGRPSPPQPRE